MKLTARERRNELIRILQKQREEPITGSHLAETFKISRELLTQDMALLKAGGHPVLATSHGYVWRGAPNDRQYKRIIVCRHSPEESQKELNILVDHGITVKDVMIEHPVYGELTGHIMVKSRKDAACFVNRMEQEQATYLMELTGGIHLHTLEAPCEDDFDAAVKALDEAGILVKPD
ncbi:transcription repressor NadR [Salisediminibacterium selenitireducens]|uniref:3H domain protein n=1 Tax=Bacillus selenitireducens (strain ATCC 700615 / DSM 15326 / MLS10) TaxID=439292 RepID=D6XYL8_BACIE|nr:transcription repressor NadR [Salisediminibacterium selenitireducens]ADH98176.1 3H domain protein [[Bacillus] selenitireducens MLS10]